jgi:hypothetical protein
MCQLVWLFGPLIGRYRVPHVQDYVMTIPCAYALRDSWCHPFYLHCEEPSYGICLE